MGNEGEDISHNDNAEYDRQELDDKHVFGEPGCFCFQNNLLTVVCCKNLIVKTQAVCAALHKARRGRGGKGGPSPDAKLG